MGACVHFVVEDLGLARLGRRNKVLVEDFENILADLGELGLNLLSVFLDESDLGRVALRLLLLLNGSDYSPRGTAGANDVLVGNGQEVALLDGQVAILRGDNLHVVDHLCTQARNVSAGWEFLQNQSWPSSEGVANLRIAQPVRRAWPSRRHLRDPFC